MSNQNIKKNVSNLKGLVNRLLVIDILKVSRHVYMCPPPPNGAVVTALLFSTYFRKYQMMMQ